MIFAVPELLSDELRAMGRLEIVREGIKFALRAPARWFGTLRRNAFARAIRGSNSIEGYHVSEEDALAAAEGEPPLDAPTETWLAINGYRLAMTYVLQMATDRNFCYSEGLLKSLHFMMTQHELKKHPGTYRPGAIYVRDEQKQVIVYEGPDVELLPELMPELIESLNQSSDTPVAVRAAMAHLNLVMIHPFSDGNGRMARALQTLVLGREGILEPPFSSIEEYLGRNTQEYYDVLAEVGQGSWHPRNNARPWIRFCIKAHYHQGKTISRRIEHTRRIWDVLEKLLAERRLPDRCIYALADATMGFKVRNSNYRNIADISLNLASRDLNTLVENDLLKAQGEARGRFYTATEELEAIRKETAPAKKIDDPFETIAPELFEEFA
ncbi:Fic family protein [soil metagenome]